MILDTSAVVAVILGEPEADRIAEAIAQAPVREISAVSLLELSIVLEARLGREAEDLVTAFMVDLGVRVLPFDELKARRALVAWREYGKGRQPAALNLGDVCSYALAAERGDLLAYKGEDFAKTDCRGIETG